MKSGIKTNAKIVAVSGIERPSLNLVRKCNFSNFPTVSRKIDNMSD